MTGWFCCINQAWRDCHSVYTEALTTPPFLRSSHSLLQSSSDEVGVLDQSDSKNIELDPELSMIMCKLLECTNQSDLKTYLLDIEAYQNGKPIEVVVTQKAL